MGEVDESLRLGSLDHRLLRMTEVGMGVILWIVMLTLAALVWASSRPGSPRSLRIGLTVLDAVFTIWVIVTQLPEVGFWWVVVSIGLSLLITLRSDFRARASGEQSSERPNSRSDGPSGT